MIERLSSRKFLVGLMLLAIAVGLEVLSPKGLTATMATFLVGLGTTYFAANVMNKKVSPVSGVTETEEEPEGNPEAAIETAAATVPAPPPEPEPKDDTKAITEAVIKELKPQLQGIANQNAVMAQILGDIAKGTTFLTNYVQNASQSR